MIDVTAEPDKKRRGLGRGLDALMPSAPAPAPAPVPAPAAPDRPRTYFAAAIEDVYPSPEQPRRRFADAELDELAVSIRAHGVIMALVVRPRPGPGGGYFLIAGERRWRAAQRAGLREVPVVVQDVDAREAFERALVENVQRADLNPIEEATAFQRLAGEFGLTQEQIAERVGKDRSTIANAVRLLKLPPSVREHVEEQRLTMGHARALLALEPAGADAIETAARAVIAKGLSVRATEELVRRSVPSQAPREKAKAAAPRKSAAIRDLEERLTRATGGPVTIVEDSPGKGGTIQLEYMDLDHLDKLLEKLL